MNSATNVPAAKVQGGVYGGAVAVIVLYLLATYAHFDPPAIVSDAITLLISAAVAYFTPPAARDVPVPTAPKGP